MTIVKEKHSIHSEPCVQEGNVEFLKQSIAKIETNVQKLHDAIKGNGKEGIELSLVKLNSLTLDMYQKVEKLNKDSSTRAEIEFELTVHQRVAKELEKRALQNADTGHKQRTITLQTIMTIIAAIGLCATTTIGLINLFKQDENGVKIDNLESPVTNSRGERVYWPSLTPVDSLRVVKSDSLK